MMTVNRAALALFGACALSVPVVANAAATLLTTQSNDAAFEGAGGYLQTSYGLPLFGNTVLPPLERAVGQVKAGSNVRRGLYTPNAFTGIPTPVGTGVTQALTNAAPFTGGNDGNFTSGTPIAFSFSRTGNTVTYTVGSTSWSDTQSYYGQIDAFEARIRSEGASAGTPSDSLAITDLMLTDTVTVTQALGGLSAADGAVANKLWSGLSGDFTLTGNYTFAWTGNQPSGSRLASQIKLLDLPATPGVPEPASWALLIAGFGFVGAGMRRRVAVAA